jgi:uncharacterized protein (TIGR03067 family)
MAVTLDGIWLPVQAELGGIRVNPDTLHNIELQIDKDNYVIKNGDLLDKGRLKFDHISYPLALDVIAIEGANAGKTIPAIFARNINSLQICYNLNGNERPKNFISQPDTQLYSVKYQLQFLRN